MPLFKDDDESYKLNYEAKFPKCFEVRYIDYKGKEFAVAGYFDEEELDTEAKVEQEAKYRLKVDVRPDIGGGASEEVRLLTEQHREAWNHLNSLLSSVEAGVHSLSDKETRLNELRQEMRDVEEDLETNHNFYHYGQPPA